MIPPLAQVPRRHPGGRKVVTSEQRKALGVQAPTLMARARAMDWDIYERDEVGHVIKDRTGDAVIDEGVLLRAKDQRLENEIGRLCVRGVIGKDQYEAGTKYGLLVRSYRMAIGAPQSTARGASIQVLPDSVDGEAFDHSVESWEEWAMRIKGQHYACERVLRDAGRAAQREVRRVCVEPSGPHRSARDLRSGLDALSEYFLS